MRDRIMASVSGLLALLDIEADPIQSREHILLSNLLDHAWRAGRSLEITDLIREIQQPPFERIGVLDVEAIFPAKDRFGLAMRLNNLLASPGFSAWLEGDPMDVGQLLYTPEGKPRISIISIAHLSDPERMFLVTLLLNEVVAWMRAQSGTSSLRALLYMDEVFGFFPPSKNPPSKTPMLTLMKQARAFGLGVVLATQNPVDLDYKGLSNAGTWFLGRLQTERDKLRVLEGLEGASAASGAQFDKAEMDQLLSGLGSRVFLMNNVHDDAPSLFHTRWVLSYLRGPLTRQHIQTLMESKAQSAPTAASASGARSGAGTTAAVTAPPASPSGAPSAATEKPLVPAGIDEIFEAWRGPAPTAGELVYRPALHATARLHYKLAKAKIDDWLPVSLLVPLGDDPPKDPWSEEHILSEPADLDTEPSDGASFVELPVLASREKSYASWSKSLKSWLYRSQSLDLFECTDLKMISQPRETRAEFTARLAQAAREERDLAVEKLRSKYAKKVDSLQGKIARAEARVEKEEAQYKQQKLQTVISVGTTVLGALFGRKVRSTRTVGSAATAARGAGRMAREKGDIGRAEDTLEDLRQQLAELEQETAAEVEEVQASFDPESLEVETRTLAPKKADIEIESVALAWVHR